MAIHTSDIALLRSIRKSAIVYLLFLISDKPVSGRYVSRILDITPKTARGYLRSLSDLGIITKTTAGYILIDGKQLVLQSNTGKVYRSLPINTTTTSSSFNNIDEVNIQEETEKETGKVYRLSESERAANKKELISCGVVINERTKLLLDLPFMTPKYIRSHHLSLLHKNKQNPAGLLVTILESGTPAPAIDDLSYSSWNS